MGISFLSESLWISFIDFFLISVLVFFSFGFSFLSIIVLEVYLTVFDLILFLEESGLLVILFFLLLLVLVLKLVVFISLVLLLLLNLLEKFVPFDCVLKIFLLLLLFVNSIFALTSFVFAFLIKFPSSLFLFFPQISSKLIKKNGCSKYSSHDNLFFSSDIINLLIKSLRKTFWHFFGITSR